MRWYQLKNLEKSDLFIRLYKRYFVKVFLLCFLKYIPPFVFLIDFWYLMRYILLHSL